MDTSVINYEELINYIYENSYLNFEDIEKVIDLETEYLIMSGIME